MQLQEAFEAFASFGTGPQTQMDNSHFSKMCKECGLVDKTFTTTDVDLLFNRIKAKTARKITFEQFAQAGIPEISSKKKMTPEQVIAKITASNPKARATVAEPTRFHDDKTSYTGVHKAGGPTTVDRDPSSLGEVVDRRGVGPAARK